MRNSLFFLFFFVFVFVFLQHTFKLLSQVLLSGSLSYSFLDLVQGDRLNSSTHAGRPSLFIIFIMLQATSCAAPLTGLTATFCSLFWFLALLLHAFLGGKLFGLDVRILEVVKSYHFVSQTTH